LVACFSNTEFISLSQNLTGVQKL